MYKYSQFWCFRCRINDNVKRNVDIRVFEHNGMIISKYCDKCVLFKKCEILRTAKFNCFCETETLDFRGFCGIVRDNIIKVNRKLLGLTEEEKL